MNDDCDDGDGNGYGDDNDDPQLIIHVLTCINERWKCKNILSPTLTSKKIYDIAVKCSTWMQDRCWQPEIRVKIPNGIW